MLKKRLLSVLLALVLIAGLFTVAAGAQSDAPTWTIMLYGVGTNLEENGGYLTWNLKQIMNAEYDENLSFLLFTGGTKAWQTPAEYLVGADAIDSDRNQLWKLEGKREGEEHGRMIYLGDLPGHETGPILTADTFGAFLDYGYREYPADQYGVFLWDHGCGPAYGFGQTEQEFVGIYIGDLAAAFRNSALVRDGGQYEFINFDACCMGNVEILVALCDYTANFIASSELVPGRGEEYTTWLNALRAHPEMDGFELGKRIVDAVIAFYDKAGGFYESPVTFSVVNTANFKARVLDRLMCLDEIFLAEASTRGAINGRYNFYDELYSLENAITYSDGNVSLYDFGNLVAALSVPQSESNNITDQAIEESRNVYTDVALAILEALRDRDGSDDDVIYASSCGIVQRIAEGCVRDPQGEVVWAADAESRYAIYPTGLSIFFADREFDQTTYYIDTIVKAADTIPDPTVKAYLLQRAKVAAYYGMISAAGYGVSGVTIYEDAANIDQPSLYATLQERNDRAYYALVGLGEKLVSLGEFETDDDVIAWISGIIDQQAAEVVSADKVSVRQIVNPDGTADTYRVITDDISAQALMDVRGSSVLRFLPDETASAFVYSMYGRTVEELYPDGIQFRSESGDGEVDSWPFMQSLSDSAADFYRTIYSTDTVTWYVPKPTREYFGVTFEDGSTYVLDVDYTDASRRAAYTPICVYHPDIKDGESLFLYLVNEDDGWKVKGFVNTYADSVDRLHPLDELDLLECQIWFGTRLKDALYSITFNIPITPLVTLDPTKENLGLTFGRCSIDDKDCYTLVGDSYYVIDVYDFWIDITDLFVAADEAAAAGDAVYSIRGVDSFTMDEVICNGAAQTPPIHLTYDGEELVESVDYRVIYDDFAGPGPVWAVVTGLNDYADYFYFQYVIQCEEHTYQTVAETAPTCTEAGERTLFCPVCWYTAVETLPACHTLTHVLAKAATETEAGYIGHWACSACGKLFRDEAAAQETTADKIARTFTGYRHDPAANAGAMKDIVADPNAVYGFRPSESGSLKQYAAADWSDPAVVGSGRQERIAYHQSLEAMYALVEQMQAEGKSIEEIARAVSAKRNELRLAAYDNDPEGLAAVKARNLEKYGHEEGPLADELYEQYGSWETVLAKAFSANLGMDACLGLYDDYYPLYVLLGQADPVAYAMTASPASYAGDGADLVFVSSADFADFLAVRVDGAVLDPANYVAKAGSTAVTFKAAYLDTLAEGEHTLTVLSKDGEASASFTVSRPVVSPKTGDGSTPMLYVVLGFFSLLALAGATLRKKV